MVQLLQNISRRRSTVLEVSELAGSRMERELDDELEVLVAILGDDIKIHDDNKSGAINIVIKLNETIKVGVSLLEAKNSDDEEVISSVSYLPPIILNFVLPEDYPEKRPPGKRLASSFN